jgi:hypothetical protein
MTPQRTALAFCVVFDWASLKLILLNNVIFFKGGQNKVHPPNAYSLTKEQTGNKG